MVYKGERRSKKNIDKKKMKRKGRTEVVQNIKYGSRIDDDEEEEEEEDKERKKNMRKKTRKMMTKE